MLLHYIVLFIVIILNEGSAMKISLDYSLSRAICRQVTVLRATKQPQRPLVSKETLSNKVQCSWVDWHKCPGRHCSTFLEKQCSNETSVSVGNSSVSVSSPVDADGVKPSVVTGKYLLTAPIHKRHYSTHAEGVLSNKTRNIIFRTFHFKRVHL
ncbi:unnamed protein product [Allacma fusca]|uniref:Uncharacterized protein n=1 Tax=Allacma fusca TaxID=39272 RepID=A0A8J2P3V8_9HEXA|nr:unnamed protein product [Allacma fusca]